MKYSIIILSLISILFSSCYLERTVDIGEIPITPQVVFNGLLYADRDTNFFYITESYPIYDDKKYNDKPVSRMIKDMKFTFEVNGEYRPAEYNTPDSAYILEGKLQEKDNITLRGRYQGKEIKSKTQLPFPPQVISIDTATIIRFESDYPKECILFRLKIKDNPGENNYFRLLINNQHYYYQSEKFHYWNQSGSYYTNDPILTNGYTEASGTSISGWNYSLGNYFCVFHDVLFKDKEHTFTFYVDKHPLYLTHDTTQSLMSIRLQSISEDLYKYYSSLQHSWSSSSGNMSVPVIVHTNIENGLGILGACNEIKIFESTFIKVNARLTKE